MSLKNIDPFTHDDFEALLHHCQECCVELVSSYVSKDLFFHIGIRTRFGDALAFNSSKFKEGFLVYAVWCNRDFLVWPHEGTVGFSSDWPKKDIDDGFIPMNEFENYGLSFENFVDFLKRLGGNVLWQN